MDALAAIHERHSTRVYGPRPLAKEVLERIVDAGRVGATARNVQPWEFIVVTDAAVRQKIADFTEFGKFLAQAPACVVVFCRDTKYYLEDGCIASENILLAAAALGVQSCWVAGDKKDYGSAIGELLGVPAGFKLISLLALGYAAGPETRRAKRPLAEVLHWERF
jgi:nitroreductase